MNGKRWKIDARHHASRSLTRTDIYRVCQKQRRQDLKFQGKMRHTQLAIVFFFFFFFFSFVEFFVSLFGVFCCCCGSTRGKLEMNLSGDVRIRSNREVTKQIPILRFCFFYSVVFCCCAFVSRHFVPRTKIILCYSHENDSSADSRNFFSFHEIVVWVRYCRSS